MDALNALIPDRRVTVTNSSVTALLSRQGDTLYCHLINTARDDSGFAIQRDFGVEIVPPADLQLAAAEAVFQSPDLPEGGLVRLEVARVNGRLRVTIPELEVYGLLVLPATPQGGEP